MIMSEVFNLTAVLVYSDLGRLYVDSFKWLLGNHSADVSVPTCTLTMSDLVCLRTSSRSART